MGRGSECECGPLNSTGYTDPLCVFFSNFPSLFPCVLLLDDEEDVDDNNDDDDDGDDDDKLPT